MMMCVIISAYHHCYHNPILQSSCPSITRIDTEIGKSRAGQKCREKLLRLLLLLSSSSSSSLLLSSGGAEIGSLA
jgi:hypothetical protein